MEADKIPQSNHHLIRMPEVVKICGLSRASIYRIIKTNEFPAPVKLSTQAVAWVHHEIMTWVEERMQQRDTKSAPKTKFGKIDAKQSSSDASPLIRRVTSNF